MVKEAMKHVNAEEEDQDDDEENEEEDEEKKPQSSQVHSKGKRPCKMKCKKRRETKRFKEAKQVQKEYRARLGTVWE